MPLAQLRQCISSEALCRILKLIVALRHVRSQIIVVAILITRHAVPRHRYWMHVISGHISCD
jgi:hypothetical protein